jgi:hypothetical protein
MDWDTGVPRVELYVRSLAGETAVRHEQVAADLAGLSERGAVDDSTVRVWGREIPAEGDHPLTDRVDAFREWADEMAVELVGLEERAKGSLVDDERPVLALPTMTLAEYREDELACVTPYRCGGRLVTVRDRLDALAPDDRDAAAPTLASD